MGEPSGDRRGGAAGGTLHELIGPPAPAGYAAASGSARNRSDTFTRTSGPGLSADGRTRTACMAEQVHNPTAHDPDFTMPAFGDRLTADERRATAASLGRPPVTDHPEYRALVAAVLADPPADPPRLAAADWLEGHGEPGRAALVRTQVAAARAPWPRGRGRALLAGLRRAVADGLPPAGRWRVRAGRPPARPGPDHLAGVTRGFVGWVAVPLPDFLALAGELFERHPVTAVRLAGVRPFVAAGRWWAWSGMDDDAGQAEGWVLPAELFARLPPADPVPGGLAPLAGHPHLRGYATEGQAVAALSAAAVSLGRAQAGLPPLVSPP